MLRSALPSALLLCCACSEYSLVDPDEAPARIANPRDLGVERVEDVWEQVAPKRTDILWVLDNSCSMVDENAELAAWFPVFMEHLHQLEGDWHVGVTTTDMGAGGLMGANGRNGNLREVDGILWIDPTTADPVDVFSQMTNVYNPLSMSSGNEMGRAAAYTALALTPGNAGFLRNDADAYLHITVVSDEEDSSGLQPIGKGGFIDWIEAIRPSRHRSTFNSIVTLTPQNPVESRGQKYIDLTEEIGGEVFDLHNDDWWDILDVLGELQAPPPIEEWFLSQPPKIETLEVLVEHLEVTFAFDAEIDWTWDPIRNSIRFTEFHPPDGAHVILRYERME